MARIIKEEEYTARRNEILEVAQRLVRTKGYEQMSIQDILDELGISKGAFYHYFASKTALLEALIDRIQDEVGPLVLAIVHDPHLPALEKLQRIFDMSARWKYSHKDYMIEILRVWYDDHNAIFRQKTAVNSLKWISPMITEVIQQGNREGTLDVPYPDHLGEIVFSVMQSFGDSIGRLILASEPRPEDIQHMESFLTAYNETLKRILGVRSSSLVFVDPETIKAWLMHNEIPSAVPGQEQPDGTGVFANQQK